MEFFDLLRAYKECVCIWQLSHEFVLEEGALIREDCSEKALTFLSLLERGPVRSGLP